MTSIALESDEDERPELQRLLDQRLENRSGALLIPNFSHLRDGALTDGMIRCLKRMQEESVPIIYLEENRLRTFANLPDNDIFSKIMDQSLHTWTAIERTVLGVPKLIDVPGVPPGAHQES